MMRKLWSGMKTERIYNKEFCETSISLFKIVLVFLNRGWTEHSEQSYRKSAPQIPLETLPRGAGE